MPPRSVRDVRREGFRWHSDHGGVRHSRQVPASLPKPCAGRLAPDFFFHDQIYRADGETVSLPPGEYTVTSIRGPEYQSQTQTITVPEKGSAKAEFKLQHGFTPPIDNGFLAIIVHAAGCAHYDSPTEGVGPEDMLRHILGEDLNIGCVLSWGPCWYTQKKYFEGKTWRCRSRITSCI